MEHLTDELLKVAGGLVSLAVTWLAEEAVRAVRKWKDRHSQDFIAKAVRTVVLATEQIAPATGVGRHKKDAVMGRIRARYPWMPVDAIEDELEAAVHEMNAELKRGA